MALTGAASVEVEAIWASLLAKALEGKDVKELLSNIGSGAGAPAAVGGAPAAAAGGAGEAAKEEKKEEKEEAKEESDDDMVRGYILPCKHISLNAVFDIIIRASDYSTELLNVAFVFSLSCSVHAFIFAAMSTVFFSRAVYQYVYALQISVFAGWDMTPSRAYDGLLRVDRLALASKDDRHGHKHCALKLHKHQHHNLMSLTVLVSS